MRIQMSLHYWVIFAAFSLGFVAVFFGAGRDDSSPISLAGRVNLDGKPLESGTIWFKLKHSADSARRDAGQPHMDFGPIENGDYVIRNSVWLIPGTYEVQIRSPAQEELARVVKVESEPVQIPPKNKLWIASRYNTPSVLEVTILRGGPSKFDFDLDNSR
jgi:hypothetical protein